MYEDKVKYLGVILDGNLNFQAHADYITRKFFKKVNFIASGKIPPKTVI